MNIEIINLAGEKVGNTDLNQEIFGVKVRPDIIARVVKWQLAKRRAGTHKVKTRGEVKHTTAKPFKQKGTGRARQGMKSVPNMRGGGIAFGPVVRSHSHKLPKKIRALGLKSVVSSKLAEGNLIIMNELVLKSYKTKDFIKNFEKLGLKSVLFVDSLEKIDNNFKTALSNIINLDIIPHNGLNVYDILKHEKLILTEEAIKGLAERLNVK
ncbi:50S ribosomal protein L4 [Candidatus Hepatincola sp. Pdp]